MALRGAAVDTTIAAGAMPSVHARVERLDALDVLARLLALRSPDGGGAGAGAGGSSGIGSLSVGGAGFGGLQGPGLGCSPAQAAALAPARSAGLLLCEVTTGRAARGGVL